MPAKSKAQQMSAGAALSAKRGETPKSKLKGASRQMVETMSVDQLEEVAETSRKALPARKTAKKMAKRTIRKTAKATVKRSATSKTARKVAKRAAPKAKGVVRKSASKTPATRQDKKRAANRALLRKNAARKLKRAG